MKSSLLFLYVPEGLFSLYVPKYAEKLFMFVPQRCKLDLIKELDFLNITFLLFLVALWKKFSLEDTLNNMRKMKTKQTLSPFLIQLWFSSLNYKEESGGKKSKLEI